MKIAILTTDNREPYREYFKSEPWFGPAPEALLQGFMQFRDIEVHVVSCTQRPMIFSPEKLADNIWFHSLHVPKIGWLRTLYQGCIRATRKKLRKIQPDIVHGQGTERDCSLRAIFSGFPNVVTIHGNMGSVARFYHSRPGSFYWLAGRLEGFTLRRTGGVCCNSGYTENLVRPFAAKTWRVPNALRPAFFALPSQTSCAARPALLNVGVISPHKQQAEILTVARKLWLRGFRFEMQFAGAMDRQSDYSAGFMRQMAEAEKAGYARYLGTLQIKELIAAMDAASALVHVPLEEAFGLVVAEGLARNLKLFAGLAGGVPDIATSVEGSELFPAGDWMALENAIARWIQTGCPRPTGAAAVMRQRYHPEIIAQRHLEIYREVLKTPP